MQKSRTGAIAFIMTLFSIGKKMKLKEQIQWLFLVSIFILSCKGQDQRVQNEDNQPQSEIELSNMITQAIIDTLYINNAPDNITRSIAQDKAGNIWFSTFDGVFKYDGKSFANISKEVSKSRFFSVLEDSKGKLWFGSIGSGAFLYNGSSFQNLTTKDGLINDEIVCIYEDNKGNIWFGANGGASMYDGNSFRNYRLAGDSILEDKSGNFIPNLQRPTNEVNSIIEDKNGQIWFGTRNRTFIYNGQSFTTVKQSGRPFINVRWIIEDKTGIIWLGGSDGLWMYNGVSFKNISTDFVGYIYEDSKGNIWTSAQNSPNDWALSYYKNSTSDIEMKPATVIKSGEGMFFGILEDSDGNIWSGTLNGVCTFDGLKFNYIRKGQAN